MRTPERWSVAIRRPDGGIHAEAHDVARRIPTTPFLRGPAGLIEAVRVGLDAFDVSLRITSGAAQSGRGELVSTLAIAAVTFLGLFGAGPGAAVGATNLSGGAADVAEGVARVAMFVVYLLLLSRSRTAAGLLAYHGAEHKVIAAYERAGVMPSIDDARPMSPVHHRCGTNFAMLFLIVAGFVYAPVTRTPLWLGAVLRIVLLPVVAALAYELMRLAARERDQVWSRIVTWPGRAAQRLTTREPDDAQLEVARTALEALLAG